MRIKLFAFLVSTMALALLCVSINANAQSPVITSLNFNAGNIAGGNHVIISGSSLELGFPFPGNVVVTFDGNVVTVVNSSLTSVEVIVPAVAVHQTVVVQVINDWAASNLLSYTYYATPQVFAIAPNKGVGVQLQGVGPATGGNQVTIFGRNFPIGITPATTISWGSSTLTTPTDFTIYGDPADATQGQMIVINAAPPREADRVDVIVNTAGGSFSLDTLNGYYYEPGGLDLVGNPTWETPIKGGGTFNAKVTLTAPAADSTTITLASNNPAVVVPASVTIPKNGTEANFVVTTLAVATDTVVTVSATAGTLISSRPITVLAPVVDTFVLSPASVAGGSSVTATVTLDGAAPVGGLTVNIIPEFALVTTVPSTVIVTAGQTSKSFTVTTNPVANDTHAGVGVYTSSIGTDWTTDFVDIAAPRVSSLTLNPSSVKGGTSSTGTVVLDSPAPVAGMTVNLSSNNGAATVSATVTVPSGVDKSATFTVTTTAVATDVTATISAVTVDTPKTSPLNISAPRVQSVTIAPSSVKGGVANATGTVTLDGPAPSGGLAVALTSDNTNATVPTSVTVAAGLTTATFAVTTFAVATDQTATVTADVNSDPKTAELDLVAPRVQSVSVSPTSVKGGVGSTGTVNLDIPAPAGGLTVDLSSNNAAAIVAATVIVPAGATSTTFAISTISVATDRTVTITASVNDSSATAGLIVLAPVVTALSVLPSSVKGEVASVGTVSVDTLAPSGGLTVNLGSSNAAATVAATTTIPAGTTTTTFNIATHPVTSQQTVTITATVNASSKETFLNVLPQLLDSLAIDPAIVKGGVGSFGTVTLDSIATTGGLSVVLSSNNSAATVPASTLVAAGALTKQFAITTSPVLVDQVATIHATLNGSSRDAFLTLKAPRLIQMTITPKYVRGTLTTTGTLTLDSPAAAGFTVNVSSADPAATVPATVVFAQNETTHTFTITTTDVLKTTPVLITAVNAGVSVQAEVWVLPLPKLTLVYPPESNGSTVAKGITVRPGAKLPIMAFIGSDELGAQLIDTVLTTVVVSVVGPSGQIGSDISLVLVSNTPTTYQGQFGYMYKIPVLSPDITPVITTPTPFKVSSTIQYQVRGTANIWSQGIHFPTSNKTSYFKVQYIR
jgi:hypothetical protein